MQYRLDVHFFYLVFILLSFSKSVTVTLAILLGESVVAEHSIAGFAQFIYHFENINRMKSINTILSLKILFIMFSFA